MSIDDYQSDLGYDDWMNSLYHEFAKDVLAGNYELYDDVVNQFTQDRLQSYYISNPQIITQTFNSFNKAKRYVYTDADASLVFALASAEVGLKSCLLKPILHGLIHDEAMAFVITELLPEQRNDKFKKILLKILNKYGGIDLMNYKRDGVKDNLWKEMEDIQQLRNDVVHRAISVNKENALKSVDIATLIIEDIIPSVIRRVGLDINSKFEIVRKTKYQI